MFSVYMLISPTDKRYVGMTKRSLNRRWANGAGYKHNQDLDADIEKYGWGSFQRIIVKQNLSEKDACKLEKHLISLYNTDNAKFGYNKTSGGDYRLCSATSNGNKGKHKDYQTCKKLSDSRKRQYSNGYTPIWINDGFSETTIDISKDSIPMGFRKGRLRNKTIYVYKGDKSKKISASELKNYINDGWLQGRGASARESAKKSNQRYIWYLDGKRFNSAADVALYLRRHGYTQIVSSTITSLYNKGFSTSKLYHNLDGRLRRIDVNEDKEHKTN